MRRKGLPLHLHFLLWVGLPTALVLIITFFVIFYFSLPKRFEKHIGKKENELSLVVNYFDFEIRSYENVAAVLGRGLERGEDLETVVRNTDLVRKVYVIAPDGVVVASFPPTMVYDVSFFPEFRRIKESYRERGFCYDFIEPGEMGFWYRGKDSRIYLFYFVRQRPEAVFCEGFPVLKVGRKGLKYVSLKASGVSKSDAFEIYSRVEENLPALLKGEVVSGTIGGERWFFLSQKSPTSGEVYFLAFPSAYFYSDVLSAAVQLGVSLLVVLPVLILTLSLVTSVFHNQISKVMKQLGDIGRGDFRLLPEEVLNRFPYELRVISESVNKLSKEIQKNFEVIAEQNEELTSQAEELKALTLELSMQNKRLIQADRTKRKFLSFISHELRTPLNSLLGMSAVLESRITDPKNRLIVSHMKSASNRMLELVNQVLELTKLELRAYTLSVYPVDVVKFLDDLAFKLSSLAAEKGVGILVLSDGEVPRLHTDANLLSNVFSNLIVNSVKYTKPCTKVRVYVCAPPGTDYVEVSVVDEGEGIRRDLVERMFEPFQRGGRRKEEGFGLGLAIAKESVEMLRGSVEVRSWEGAGTEFRVRLPLSVSGRDLVVAYTYQNDVADLLFTVFENEKLKHKITRKFSEFVEMVVKNKPRLAAVVVHTKNPRKVAEVLSVLEDVSVPVFAYVSEEILGLVVDEVSRMDQEEIFVMREDRIIKVKEALARARVVEGREGEG